MGSKPTDRSTRGISVRILLRAQIDEPRDMASHLQEFPRLAFWPVQASPPAVRRKNDERVSCRVHEDPAGRSAATSPKRSGSPTSSWATGTARDLGAGLANRETAETWILSQLPSRFAGSYSALFARQFRPRFLRITRPSGRARQERLTIRPLRSCRPYRVPMSRPEGSEQSLDPSLWATATHPAAGCRGGDASPCDGRTGPAASVLVGQWAAQAVVSPNPGE